MQRRGFIKTVWAALHALGLSALTWTGAIGLRRALAKTYPAPSGQQPTRPPCALDEPAFLAACTRCYLCGLACPTHAIRFPEQIVSAQVKDTPVWLSKETPMVLPWIKGCEMCMQCTEACPTGALVRTKKDPDVIQAKVKMGTARVDRKICLPWTKTSWCGACFTVCPYKNEAITVDYRNRPTIHKGGCTGCGLCVEVCPIKYKAIAIEPPFGPDRGRMRGE